MHIKIWIYIALFSLLNWNCKDRCESEKVGDTQIHPDTERFLPYEDGEEILLISENGDQELRFVNERIEETGRICTKYKCTITSDPFVGPDCEYVEVKSLRNVLRAGDSLIIDMVATVENYEEESFLFYDLVIVNMSGVGALASGHHVTNLNFTDPPFLQENTSWDPYFEFVFQWSTVAGLYQAVYKSPSGPNEIIIKQDFGIVAIRLNDTYFFIE